MAPKSRDAIRLTPVQQDVLEALRDGAVMTIDRHNMPWLGSRPLQPQTRYFLIKKVLITRRDRSSAVTANGNGYVISTEGLAALRAAAIRTMAQAARTTFAPEGHAQDARPATERQLAYAESLGIAIPEDPLAKR